MAGPVCKALPMCLSIFWPCLVQVRQRVDEVLAQVDMTERFGDLVGTPGISGLSTEARKRLMIAVELMANAPVLFMDEPTSGKLTGQRAIVVAVKTDPTAHTIHVAGLLG